MTRRACWGGFALLVAPFGAWALGLGDIELRSALNQPLDADIELVSATADELANLRVALASPETFARYGLDRPAYLGRLSFGLGRDDAGRSVIRVTSAEAITEPFVTVLVEATWTRGRLLREYTVLLDPPVMLPAEAAVEPVQPAATRLPAPTEPAAVIRRPAPAPAPQPVAEAAPSPAPVAPVTSPRSEPQPAPATRPAAPAPTPSGDAYGPVQRGETLWGIASRNRPSGTTMNQMMVAIFEANPAAFAGNMNVLRAGATLVMPSEAALARLGAAEATQEAIRQTAEWEGRAVEQQARLRLLPPEVEAAPNVSTAAAGANVAPGADAGEPAAEQGDAAATTGGGQPTESARILEIQDEALSNLQQQLADEPELVESTPIAADEAADVDGLVEPGVDLESEGVFADDATAPADGLAGDADPVVEEPVVAPPPRAVSTTPAATTTSSPSLVSQVIGWLTTPLLWMGLGLVLLVGAGFVYLRSRQADAEDMTGRWESLEVDDDEDFETREATERLRSQVRIDDETIVVEEQHTQEMPQPERTADLLFDEDESIEFEGLPDVELDDADSSPSAIMANTVETIESPAVEEPFAPEATMSSQTVINLDQADPIAEADFHMAYGLYDQAADLVAKALEADPSSRELRLKLLEVYFVWGNRESFLDSARALRAAIGDKPDADWDKVVIMGKQICPDESLFAESAGVAADRVDLDLAAGDSPDLDLSFDDQGESPMDLDLGEADDTGEVTLEFDSASADGTAELDLDIGSQTAAGLEAALLGSGKPDESAETSPNLDLDSGDAATLEVFGPESPTMESPQLDEDTSLSAELPTLEQPGLSAADLSFGDQTAEIDLDDLGLDVSDLPNLSDSSGFSGASLLDADQEDDDVLSATGVTQVLSADELANDADDVPYTRTEVLEAKDSDDGDATAQFRGISFDEADDSDSLGLDIDLDELSAALDGGDTVEQPSVARFGGTSGLDLDVGLDPVATDDSTATEQLAPLDAQTLTEVGTKLDLARAYIDMGDPEGARSILKEVLDEGDSSQQKEAKGLIEALGA